MNLPSKELLSAVFGVTVTKTMTIDDNILYCEWNYLSNDTNGTDINLYELAHMCKEWAFKSGYMILVYCPSYYDEVNGFTDLVYECRIEEPLTNNFIYHTETINTEPEAIFKACQWLLDNKEHR